MRLLTFLALTAAAFGADALPPKQPLWEGTAPGLREDEAPLPTKPSFTVHLPAKSNGAAMIICPGGGYGGLVTGAEGHGIAQWLNANGIAGIVLEYRLPVGHPNVPILDAQQALRLTRLRASEWKINPKKVGIIGFSAGGHLAATAATHTEVAYGGPATTSTRPDFAILVYPVVTMQTGTHGGSKKNLLGPKPTDKLVEFFSAEKQVSKETPPTFLAHALDDKLVPIENSRVYYAACLTKGVKAQLLELPTGGHGLNGYKGPSWDAWQKQSLDWLRDLKFIP